MTKPFVHLHLHSEFSLLDGAIKFDPLLERVKEFGMPAVALTDHGNLFGAVEFARKAKSAGIKPIIGCEAYITPQSRRDRTPASRTHHLTVLAMDEEGYKNISQLSTLGYLEGFYRRPRLDHELLESHSKGLIVLSGCLNGELCAALLQNDMPSALRTASMYKEMFGDRYYIEIQATRLPEQTAANAKLIEIGAKLGIGVVATNDCHYLRKEDAKPHDILLCIQTGSVLADEKRMKFPGDEFYLKSWDEMLEGIEGMEEPLEKTLEIGERCGFEFTTGSYKMPVFEVEGEEPLDDYFELLARDGLKNRLEQSNISPDEAAQYTERLTSEIEIIKKMGFSGYFLMVSDFINYAKKKSIPVGPGRGSAAGSLVAYSLGITDVDPIPHNLLFERFLNPERISMPDIDVDLCTEGRDEIIAYVTQKYGTDKVAQIGTFGTMSAKACVKDVGRVLGLPYAEVDKVTKTIPTFRGKVKSLEECVNQVSPFKELIEKSDAIRGLVEVARPLENMVRHSSTHAAGIVISNEPLMNYIPLYKGQQNEIVTQYDMNGIEHLGYVKFDFLGLKTLTVINRALKFINPRRSKDGAPPLDVSKVPLDDPGVYKLLSSGRTKGVFQLESRGMVELLTRMESTTFEDLIAVLALYRPGPLDSGMVEDFIKRKLGKKKITYPLPQLREILEETYGLFVYQEQIMSTACIVADYSVGEADLLRRAMGKKKPQEMKAQRARFLEGASKKGISKAKAEKLFSTMEKFAEYSFNKSHSTAYALITYQTAYLKVHYPCEFMAALMSVESGNTDKIIESRSECGDLGIEVLAPDVNESMDGFTPVGGKIRFGLSAIKNIGESTVSSILKARENGGRFTSIFDFSERVEGKKLNRRAMESLIKSGAFDSLGHSRAELTEGLDSLLSYISLAHNDGDKGQSALFALEDTITRPKLPEVEEWDEDKKLDGEMDAIGFYVSGHPMEKYSSALKRVTNADTESVLEMKDRERVVIAGVPRSANIRTTKNSGIYGNVVLEDLKGSVEIIAFGNTLRDAIPALEKKVEPIVVKGTIECTDDRVRIKATEITSYLESRISSVIHINLTHVKPTKNKLDSLASIMERYSGPARVHLHLLTEDLQEVVLEVGDYRVEPTEGFINDVSEAFGKGVLGFSRAD